ncbi:hypothetical protein C1H46_006507 [Malus baccata]|uniref:Uncharacterized protein n=1 Tax=Malus baccata TaxID=106549 RepID=A0A540NA01_MALBA|nr:hypothetical protein C1H46_006507 [Malus baccata]
MTVVAVNPNRVLAISFDSLQVTISYKTDTGDKGRDVLLTTKPVPPPPSPLNTETSTAHSFKMETVSAYVGDYVANQISEGRARGSVKFVFGMLGYYSAKSEEENVFADLTGKKLLCLRVCSPIFVRYKPAHHWMGSTVPGVASVEVIGGHRVDFHDGKWVSPRLQTLLVPLGAAFYNRGDLGSKGPRIINQGREGELGGEKACFTSSCLKFKVCI